MFTEIERKFLINTDKLPDDFWDAEYTNITQYYIVAEEGLCIRLRDRSGSYTLGIKGMNIDIERPEFEMALTKEMYDTFFEKYVTDLTPRISKRRYEIRHDVNVWEVDIFPELNNLILAEIELSSVTETFKPPPWIGKEVSDNKKYYNAVMAKSMIEKET